MARILAAVNNIIPIIKEATLKMKSANRLSLKRANLPRTLKINVAIGNIVAFSKVSFVRLPILKKLPTPKRNIIMNAKKNPQATPILNAVFSDVCTRSADTTNNATAIPHTIDPANAILTSFEPAATRKMQVAVIVVMTKPRLSRNKYKSGYWMLNTWFIGEWAESNFPSKKAN